MTLDGSDSISDMEPLSSCRHVSEFLEYVQVNFNYFALTALYAPLWNAPVLLRPFSRDLTIPHLDLSHFALCIMGN